MKTLITDFGKIEIDLEDFRQRWLHDGTKCGLQLRETRVTVGQAADMHGETVGDEIAFPIYPTFIIGSNPRAQRRFNYTLVYSFKVGGFALSQIGFRSNNNCKDYHNLNAEDKARIVEKIIQSVAEVMTKDDLATPPAVYRLLSSSAVFSTKKSARKEKVDLTDAVKEVLIKFNALALRMTLNGTSIVPEPHKYDQLTAKSFNNEELGSRIEGQKLDLSMLQSSVDSDPGVSSDDVDDQSYDDNDRE